MIFQRVALRKKYVWIEWTCKDLSKQTRKRNKQKKWNLVKTAPGVVTEVIKNKMPGGPGVKLRPVSWVLLTK